MRENELNKRAEEKLRHFNSLPESEIAAALTKVCLRINIFESFFCL